MPRTTTPTEQPRFVLGAGGADELLLPDNLSAVPDRVRELNAEAVRLRDAALLAAQQLQAPRPRPAGRSRSTRQPTVQPQRQVSRYLGAGPSTRRRRRSSRPSGGRRPRGRTRATR